MYINKIKTHYLCCTCLTRTAEYLSVSFFRSARGSCERRLLCSQIVCVCLSDREVVSLSLDAQFHSYLPGL